MCAEKSSYQYDAWSLISYVWRVCEDGIVHDGDFSACHLPLCVRRMFILCFSYLDHFAAKSGHRSGDFYDRDGVISDHATLINPASEPEVPVLHSWTWCWWTVVGQLALCPTFTPLLPFIASLKDQIRIAFFHQCIYSHVAIVSLDGNQKVKKKLKRKTFFLRKVKTQASCW